MEYNFNFKLNTSKSRALNLFWLGVIFYTVSSTLLIAMVNKYHSNYIIFQIFQTFGIVTIFSSAIILIKFKFTSAYLKFFFFLYCLWTTTVIFRGFNFEYTFLKEMLFDSWFGILPFFVPLILLFPQNSTFYKKVIGVILVLGIIYLIFDAFFIRNLLSADIKSDENQMIEEYFTKDLGLPCGFLLLTYMYLSKRNKLLAWFVSILSLFFAIIRARRALILITISPIVFTYIIYVARHQRILVIIISAIVLSCILAIYASDIGNSGIFHSVKERGMEDTRAPVEECFYTDMQPMDWLVGRGINAKYYCPAIEEDEAGGFRLYRTVIETDYLNIILRGGIVSLAILLLIAIPAMLNGFFNSKNTLSKAAGLWILIWLLSLYPTSVNIFSMGYMLVWISIGICYNKKIRNISENSMKAYLAIP
jgi:hypothetical protein